MLPELLTTAVPIAPLQAAGLDAPLVAELFLVGRILFGGVLAFTGLNHFLDTESMVGYADAKGVPAAGLAVPVTGGMLVFGGLGIALGILPTLAAGALVVFLLVTTPLMHDFWAVPEDQRQSEMTAFLKNAGLLGTALVLLALSATAWPYAL
ncbi:DoxX family protein [Halalkalicoccus sp. NIPERK01]|uniref:DoxX family protein n=1 Tax=Halalkalicoccus sp. NIPERK01 TaxID=3053469 RepID=UPI00256F015F|nr:DoxX family protein [Halalkalicoccus sp. NIPERK01]MDL5360686.1 DoxX family protein [Halalkalicoccus sp. NIPERK01]